MAKSPRAAVKEQFGDKEKLIEALKTFMSEDLWVNRLNEKKGLDHVSNAKLLRLHRIFSAVKSEFGSREKLVDSILAIENRSKDTGLRAKLNGYPVPRLYDIFKSAKKRSTPKPAPKAKAANLNAPSAPCFLPAPGRSRRGCRRHSPQKQGCRR